MSKVTHAVGNGGCSFLQLAAFTFSGLDGDSLQADGIPRSSEDLA